MARPALEVADILRDHGPAWREANHGACEPRAIEGLNAHENEPTWAQFSGPTECAGMSNGRVMFGVVDGLVDWKREGRLLH